MKGTKDGEDFERMEGVRQQIQWLGLEFEGFEARGSMLDGNLKPYGRGVEGVAPPGTYWRMATEISWAAREGAPAGQEKQSQQKNDSARHASRRP